MSAPYRHCEAPQATRQSIVEGFIGSRHGKMDCFVSLATTGGNRNA